MSDEFDPTASGGESVPRSPSFANQVAANVMSPQGPTSFHVTSEVQEPSFGGTTPNPAAYVSQSSIQTPPAPASVPASVPADPHAPIPPVPPVAYTRINPFMRQRLQQPELERDLSDPHYPNEVIKFKMRFMDSVQQTEVTEIAREMHAKYVTGDKSKGMDPQTFPHVGGEPVKLTWALCVTVASVCVMQVPIEGFAPYTFEELVAISLTHPGVWRGILMMTDELTTMAEGLAKN